jgi:small subunit ribosomal protein S1
MTDQQLAVLDSLVGDFAGTIEAGLIDDPSTHPMALLMQQIDDEHMSIPQPGEIRQGFVVEKRSNEVLIDIGFKSEGMVIGRELERIGDYLADVEIGSELPVYVLREDREGNVLLSIARALAEHDWKRAEELFESQEVFDGIVSACNRGGVIVKLGHVRGFVPASQLSSESQGQQQPEIEPDDRWAGLMGETLRMKVIDLDRRRNRLILSERVAMREWRREQKEKLLESLVEGAVREGVISSLADFGAFVNLGGADGLIHLSELSWGRVNHPKEVVEVGQKVQVKVISVDQDRKRIGLSLRRLQPEPWETVEDNYSVGQIVSGTITKLVDFGAFARLKDEPIEGLIHISELAERRIGHPREVVAEGEEHDLRIIRIDSAKRRMGLSLKQALPEEELEPEVDWRAVPLEENPELQDSSDEVEGDVVAEDVAGDVFAVEDVAAEEAGHEEHEEEKVESPAPAPEMVEVS